MKHLGDITKLSGYVVPAVDVVIGGSPCQGLSVAGKQAGLKDERSGLFIEQIRLVKEMREADAARGKTNDAIRPRYMVWENVPGAFSSNQGRDFEAVLEETVRVAEPKAPPIPVPAKGWPTSGCLMGDGWSVAWRVLDAQFWGTSDKPLPQRRRRISLVADFGGRSAPEILFERESVSWNPDESRPERKVAPGRSKASPSGRDRGGEAHTLKIRSGCAGGGNGELVQTEKSATLSTFVADALPFDSTQVTSPQNGCNPRWGDPCHPLAASAHTPTVIMKVYDNHAQDARYSELKGCGMRSGVEREIIADAIPINDKATRFKGGGATRNQDGAGNGLGVGKPGDPSPTLTAADRHILFAKTAIAFTERGRKDGRNCETMTDTMYALTNPGDGGRTNSRQVCYAGIVRRFTPLECERLQGYPDGWTDIGSWVDSKGKKHPESSDAARYKALGNSIAIPPWKWVLKRLCAIYERDATMASLFDGIGGFPYIWEQLNGKGSCLWASEIEPFPIAVTKYHFGED